jgi:hypothetical protein
MKYDYTPMKFQRKTHAIQKHSETATERYIAITSSKNYLSSSEPIPHTDLYIYTEKNI